MWLESDFDTDLLYVIFVVVYDNQLKKKLFGFKTCPFEAVTKLHKLSFIILYILYAHNYLYSRSIKLVEWLFLTHFSFMRIVLKFIPEKSSTNE